jgi:hypothetical protein
MTLSEYTISVLAKAIAGDSQLLPYLSGPQIVHFFNKFGDNDVYGGTFPTRWVYVQEKLRALNGTDKLRLVIEEAVDPRRYIESSKNVDEAVKYVNEALLFDGYELKKTGKFYKVCDGQGMLVQPVTVTTIGHDFIMDQVAKCRAKIESEDYTGAITNARTLIEAIFLEIISRSEGNQPKNDGNIDDLWRRVKKAMKLNLDRETLPEFIMQIIGGLESSLKGLAALSNNAADRHAHRFNTRKHHAKLAVNVALTLADFLLDSWDFINQKASSNERT